MKLVDRRAFLRMPSGVIYCKGQRWTFDGLAVKGETLASDDWVYEDFNWIAAGDGDIGDACDMFETMLSDGHSAPMQDRPLRDGCFDPDAVFLVFELADLLILRDRVHAAIRLEEQKSHVRLCDPSQGVACSGDVPHETKLSD